MIILTEQTPNPAALKFIPDARLTDGGAMAFHRDSFDPSRSSLAERLFALTDVTAVYIGPTFVTVTRSPTGRPWSALRLDAVAAIAAHLASGAPAVAAQPPGQASGQPTPGADEEIEAQILSVLHRWVRPGVARDGGDVLFDRFDAGAGVLWIRMQGACGGCPSSRLTLKAGIERIVRRYVPEVLRVEDAAVETGAPNPSRLKSWLAKLPARTAAPTRPEFTHRGRSIRKDRNGARPPLP